MPEDHEHWEFRSSGLADDETGDATDSLQSHGTFPAELDRPSLALRFRVLILSRRLDEELARGANPERTSELALRARRLVDVSRREHLAASLENLVEYAERRPAITDPVPLARREICESSALLRMLAARLRDPRPVYARGAALISQLVHDGTGPAFTPGAGVALRHAIWAATDALDGNYPDQLRAPR
jgi:hypothetical protein